MRGKLQKIFMAALALCLISRMALADPVSSVEINGLKRISEEKVRDVIAITSGDEFSLTELDRSVRYLRDWGVFDEINVSPSKDPDGVTIDYRLKEATVVSSIEISGNYPFVENKVRKYLTLHAGDIYTPQRVDEQVGRIKEFYARQGYVGTEVYIEQEENPEVSGIDVTLHIKNGVTLRYRNVEVEGNRAFPDSRFSSSLNTWKPFSEQRLRASIEKLVNAYHDHGYPKARIKVAKKEIDFESGSVDLLLKVSEGPRVKIKFTGAPHASRKRLRKQLTIFKFESVDDYEMEASAASIKKFMGERGYPDARVEWKKSQLADDSLLIEFAIEPGAPRRIKELRFVGAKDVRSKKLAEEMKNKRMALGRRGTYFPEYVINDDKAIAKALARDGYLDSTVGEWEVKPTEQGFALNVTIPIEQGPKTLVGEIDFVGSESFPPEKLIKALKIKRGDPLNEPGLEEDRLRLLSFYRNNGHPYAEVGQQYTISPAHEATITYDVREEPLVRIGQVLIVGDVLTSQNAIMGAMALKEGDPFSEKKLIDSQLNIRRLGPFSYVSVETIGVAEKRDVVHVKVRVEEQKPFMLDLGINYSTDQSLTGQMIFRNINSFGWAKTNTLKLMAGVNLSRAEIGWYDPRFFGSSVEMTSGAWIQYYKAPSYAYTQVAGTLGWARKLRRLSFFFQWELDRNYFVEGDSVAADADSLRDNTISKISLTQSYDSRDSFSFPTKGVYTIAGVDIFNEIGGDDANFFRFKVKGEFDYGFWSRIVFSTTLRLDRILTIGRNVSVPTNELLFMGGDDTVRGFSYQSLGPVDAAGKATGSRARWIFNEELRFLLFKNLSFAGFYDMGSLTNEFSDVGWSSTVRKSAGMGLRYNTPVGPIRADYGFKIDRKPGESIGHFHLTFGYLF